MIIHSLIRHLIRCAVFAVIVGNLLVANAYSQTGPEVFAPIKRDTSPELRNIKPKPRNVAAFVFRRIHPVRLNPNRRAPNAAALTLPDPVVQRQPGPAVGVTLEQGFDGVGSGFTGPEGSFTIEGSPPDTVGAVGETQFVQWVNSSFAVFDKATGKTVFGPVPGNTIWKGFKGACETSNDGDPIVQYDKAAKRWVMAQFSISDPSGFFQCVAVSTTSDAMGKYRRFQFKYSDFDDYPKMGVWTDGYYISFNMFRGNSFIGSRVCAYDREAMLGNVSRKVTQQCFQLSPSIFGLLPSDLDGATPPPAGSPNYFLTLNSNSLDLWKFHVDWANSTSSTFGVGADHAPNTNIKVGAFRDACGGSDCITQSEVNGMLDSLGERLMYRLAYRNFGDHESLVVNHSVDALGSAAVRWYELRDPNGAALVFQQGTFAPDSNHRWMGSIAMDKVGNIAVGYNVSSNTIHPGIRMAGRAPADPLNKLGSELTIIDGGGSQNGVTRWGDYSALTVDPVDDCRMWFTTEFLKTTGGDWNTRVASFRFSSCH